MNLSLTDDEVPVRELYDLRLLPEVNYTRQCSPFITLPEQSILSKCLC